MGGKSSKSSPSSSSPSSPSKAAFGVDISSDLINNLKDLHGGSPVSGDDLGNDADTKAMTIEQWRVKDSQRNAELDVYVKDIEVSKVFSGVFVVCLFNDVVVKGVKG